MKLPSSIIVPILNVIQFCASVSSEKVLNQVVILSRHNVRTPLAKDLSVITPKPWPKWKEKSGYLTEKGKRLEGYMGKYFVAWLKSEKLLPESCPNEEEFFVYANNKQRTLQSAKAFVKHGFPSCNVTVHHSINDTDIVFNPVLHNSSEIFKELALQEMGDHLKTLSLNVSYNEMEGILDYKDSELCLKKGLCDLTTDKNKIINVKPDVKPAIDGPLKVSKSAVDAFLMAYYEGFPVKNVAWGSLTNTTKWKLVMELSKGYHNVILNTTVVAKDIAKPLVKYLADIFIKNKTNIAFLMGHDANLYTVLNSLNFKPYILKKQFELTPIGGKIVFQKWKDIKTNEDFLKIDYVYQPSRLMRRGQELSLMNPPEWVTLEINSCRADVNGFCPWNDFIEFLKNVARNEADEHALMFEGFNSPFIVKV